MSPKRRINGRDFVRDLRAGLSDGELMEKYDLSSRMLQSVFRKLINARAITPADIYERSPFDETTVDVDTISYSLTGYTAMSAHVYEVSTPEILGQVLDLTEKELKTGGIEAGFAQVMTFIVLAGKAAKIEPIYVRAKCKWCNHDETTGEAVAGFEIVEISEEHKKELRKLIRAFAVTAGGT